MNTLAFSLEQVQGFGIAFAVLLAFVCGAWAIDALRKWDIGRCWAKTQARREREQVAALKATRGDLEKAKEELTKLRSAFKGTKTVAEVSEEVDKRKAANQRCNNLERENKELREQLEESSRECWQLQCELKALNGRPTGPMTGAGGEYYERRNGTDRVPLQDFNRSR